MTRLTHQRIHNLRNRFRRCQRRSIEVQSNVNLLESAGEKTSWTKEEIRISRAQIRTIDLRIEKIKYIAMVNGFSLN